MFNCTKEKKEEYWNHFLECKDFHHFGMTIKRLEKIKPVIFEDKQFWDDILFRHGGDKMTPQEMKEKDDYSYMHCFGNFTGMVGQTLVDRGIIKP